MGHQNANIALRVLSVSFHLQLGDTCTHLLLLHGTREARGKSGQERKPATNTSHGPTRQEGGVGAFKQNKKFRHEKQKVILGSYLDSKHRTVGTILFSSTRAQPIASPPTDKTVQKVERKEKLFKERNRHNVSEHGRGAAPAGLASRVVPHPRTSWPDAA